MKLKNIKISTLISNMIITLAYPVIKYFISDGDRLLKATDALTIIALILVIFGVVIWMYNKGDFDITEYVISRSPKRVQKPYDAYVEDKKEEREKSFNYPLFLSIIYFIAAGLISVVFY